MKAINFEKTLNNALARQTDPPEDLNQTIKSTMQGEKIRIKKEAVKRFVKLSPAVIAACLILFVGVVGVSATVAYQYFFKSIDIPFACEFDVSIQKSEKVGWIGEVAGKGNMLHITYSQLDIMNDDGHMSGEEMILIDGEGGSRRFLSAAATTPAVYNRKGLLGWQEGDEPERVFWSAKLIDFDSSSFGKDYDQDTIEVAYLFFDVKNDEIINVYTRFSELDARDRPKPFAEMKETFHMPYRINQAQTINFTGTFPAQEFIGQLNINDLLAELPPGVTQASSSKIDIDFASVYSLTDLLKRDITLADIKSSGYEAEPIDVVYGEGSVGGGQGYILNGKKNIHFYFNDSLDALYIPASIALPELVGIRNEELPFIVSPVDHNFGAGYVINGLDCWILLGSPYKLAADDWVYFRKSY